MPLPKCAVRVCANEADPRWFARDVHGRVVMICDGHDPLPAAEDVVDASSDPGVLDLAERIIYGHRATAAEVLRVAHALLVETAGDLPPELMADRQRWVDKLYAAGVAKAEAEIDAAWEDVTRDHVHIVRCRRCQFETFRFADATIEKHMEDCAHAQQGVQ